MSIEPGKLVEYIGSLSSVLEMGAMGIVCSEVKEQHSVYEMNNLEKYFYVFWIKGIKERYPFPLGPVTQRHLKGTKIVNVKNIKIL